MVIGSAGESFFGVDWALEHHTDCLKPKAREKEEKMYMRNFQNSDMKNQNLAIVPFEAAAQKQLLTIPFVEGTLKKNVARSHRVIETESDV